MSEKRRFIRFNVVMEAICRKLGRFKKLKVNNFSKEGLGILSKEALSEGEKIEIELMIPGDNVPIVCEGEIAWTNTVDSKNSQYKCGIKFKKISNVDKNKILEYIYKQWIVPAGSEAR